MIVRRYKNLTAVFIILSIVYLALSIALPADKTTLAKYHISAAQDVGIILTIAIPYLVIWFIALVGSLRLKEYTERIRKSKDGRAFKTISQGVFILTAWLPVSAIMGDIASGIYHAHHSLTAEMVSLNNYLNVVILFTAFWWVHKGTRQLLAVIKKPVPRLPQTLMMVFISLSSFYLFLVLRDPARQFPTHSVLVAAYYLPDWLIVTTIVIPSLITWHLGMQAVYNLYLYQRGVKGRIYKDGLGLFANGIAGVIVTIVVLRGFQSISAQFTNLTLTVALIVVYMLLVIISVGYIYIAKGAKSLLRIEEI